MAEHLIVKPEVLVATAVGMLEQDLALPNTFQKEGIEKFVGAEGDAYAVKVEGVLPYRTYGWRNDRTESIKYDELAERKTVVQFGDDIYSGVRVTDEQMKMDVDGWAKFLRPQTKAVGRGLQYKAVDHLVGADYAVTIGNAEQNLRGALIEARKVLNAFNVPDEQRWLVVGTDFESALLNDDKLNLAQNVGEGEAVSALREATIGRRMGFNIVVDQTIPSDAAYAYVRSAFIFMSGAPVKPTGAAYGASTSYEGIGLSWIVDYDMDKQRDRSVVKTFPGFRSVKDVLVARDADTKQEFVVPGEHFVRGIRLSLDGASDYPEVGSDLAKATGVSAAKVWTPSGRKAEADPANA
jgi:hypothetical protein